MKLEGLIANYNNHNWEGGLLGKMLLPPLSGTEVAVGGATGDSANHKWCENVVVVFDQLLAGKYPFSSSKHAHEAPVADIDKVFQPKTGALWQYFDGSLKGDFDHPPGTDIFHLKDQPSVKYKPGLAVFLKRAQDLTNLLYAKDGAKLGMTVSVRIRASAPYTKIIFESAGRKLTYFNTKERWEDVVWPGGGAVFRTFQNANEAQLGYPEGEWALFHLLDDGKLAPPRTARSISPEPGRRPPVGRPFTPISSPPPSCTPFAGLRSHGGSWPVRPGGNERPGKRRALREGGHPTGFLPAGRRFVCPSWARLLAAGGCGGARGPSGRSGQPHRPPSCWRRLD